MSANLQAGFEVRERKMMGTRIGCSAIAISYFFVMI